MSLDFEKPIVELEEKLNQMKEIAAKSGKSLDKEALVLEDKIIELKNIEDSFASAANYLKTIGWKKDQPCFIKIELKDNIPKKYLNSSARSIKNKKNVFFFKKYIMNFDELKIENNLKAAIIIPDKDIIPGSETLSPAFIIFENYEKILSWNRSLRFALAVCTLKENFKNEI